MLSFGSSARKTVKYVTLFNDDVKKAVMNDAALQQDDELVLCQIHSFVVTYVISK